MDETLIRFLVGSVVAAADTVAMERYLKQGRPFKHLEFDHLAEAWLHVAQGWFETFDPDAADLEAEMRAEMNLRGKRCPEGQIAVDAFVSEPIPLDHACDLLGGVLRKLQLARR
jgi:hypothetical protein